jgi:signal transduction histidine kinase
MRRRLVAAFVGLATALIVLFGVPRGIVVAQLVESERQALLDKSAEVAGLVVADATEDGRAVTPETFDGLLDEEEVLELRTTDGSSVVVPAGAEQGTDDLSAARTVPGVGTVTVAYPQEALRSDVTRTLAPLALLAVVLVVLAGVAGWLLARRLARPFVELAEVAERLGRGRLDPELPQYGLREADAIARALEDSSQRLRRMTRREREVSDYASHDLRTPITALRLTLEDLALWPGTPPEVAQELSRIVGEVDRFSEAVNTLVDAPSSQEDVGLVDVAALVRDVLRDRVARTGAPVPRIVADSPVLARLRPVATRRAVELLVEHATSVSVGGEASTRVIDGNGYLTVVVRGLPDHSTANRSVVWDQAVGAATEVGGRLTGSAAGDGPGAWTLTLPKGTTWSDA